MDMIKHYQSTQSNKFAIPLHYLKKEVRDGVAFAFYCDAKHSDILWGSSHSRCYLFQMKPNAKDALYFLKNNQIQHQ